MTAINPKLSTTGHSFLSSKTNSQNESKQPTQTSPSGYASWFPSTKAAVTAGGILATLGAGFLTYQNLSNNTIPNEVTPSNPLGTIFKTITGLAIVAVLTRFALKNINNNKNTLKAPEIQDPQVKEFITKLQSLNVKDFGFDKEYHLKEYHLFDSIIRYFNDTNLPLNDDQKKLTKTLADSLKDRLVHVEQFNSNFHEYLSIFKILLKADKDSALEIAKSCLPIIWKKENLNLIEFLSFYKEMMYTEEFSDKDNNLTSRILRIAFYKESEIKTDLYQYCLQKTRQCANTAEIYNNDFSLDRLDFTFLKLFLEECALLDNNLYANFQQNVVWKLWPRLQENTLPIEEQFCIQDMFLKHNHPMFFHFLDAAKYAKNGTFPNKLLQHAAVSLATNTEMKEKLKIAKDKNNTNMHFFTLIENEIKNYVSDKEKLKKLKNLSEIVEHIQKYTKRYPNFLKDEPDEFFTNLNSLIIQALTQRWTLTKEPLSEAYDILFEHRKDEALKLAKSCLEKFFESEAENSTLNKCRSILKHVYQSDEGISITVDFLNELGKSNKCTNIKTFWETQQFILILDSFYDSNEETQLKLFEECIKKLDYDNFNHYLIEKFITQNRFDYDKHTTIADILLKIKKNTLIDHYITICDENYLNDSKNYIQLKIKIQEYERSEDHKTNVSSTYEAIEGNEYSFKYNSDNFDENNSNSSSENNSFLTV